MSKFVHQKTLSKEWKDTAQNKKIFANYVSYKGIQNIKKIPTTQQQKDKWLNFKMGRGLE